VRRTIPHVADKIIDVPLYVMKNYRDITLAGDIMYVNKVTFFVTTSHHILGSAQQRWLETKKHPRCLKPWPKSNPSICTADFASLPSTWMVNSNPSEGIMQPSTLP
jgi:hypothetical protein